MKGEVWIENDRHALSVIDTIYPRLPHPTAGLELVVQATL
jgi:hypothetical protein